MLVILILTLEFDAFITRDNADLLRIATKLGRLLANEVAGRGLRQIGVPICVSPFGGTVGTGPL